MTNGCSHEIVSNTVRRLNLSERTSLIAAFRNITLLGYYRLEARSLEIITIRTTTTKKKQIYQQPEVLCAIVHVLGCASFVLRHLEPESHAWHFDTQSVVVIHFLLSSYMLHGQERQQRCSLAGSIIGFDKSQKSGKSWATKLYMNVFNLIEIQWGFELVSSLITSDKEAVSLSHPHSEL